MPAAVHADGEKTVRVGYYENEVFQEGAREGAVRTGYAYEKVFDAFSRERNSMVSGIPGTGLGMAITIIIVEMMGGMISVISEEGMGSEFTVCIPCRFCSMEEESVSSGKASGSQLPLPDFSGKRVLLAEDNEMNQMIAVKILQRTGCEVEIAGDGAEALEKMNSAPTGYYDIILMDIQIPKMDGYEAARRIRAMEDPEKARIPIVAVTANAFDEDRKTSADAGLKGHLAKPYDIPKMMEMLDRLFASEE